MIAYKTPAERQAFVYDFDADLGLANIASIEVGTPVAVARDGGALITVFGAPVVAARVIEVKWQGGVAGESYLTTVRVIDTAGQIHERTGEIRVAASGFAVPEALASRYLTGEEYVARYGSNETIRLTDEAGLRVVDGAKLEEAIKDQTDIADAYIGNRYAVPLGTPPRVIKSIVAALTREALHKTKPTPEVTAAADRARVQLRDISAGRMGLPIEDGGTAPVIGGNRTSITSGDGTGSSFRDQLDGYSINPGGSVAAWRR